MSLKGKQGQKGGKSFGFSCFSGTGKGKFDPSKGKAAMTVGQMKQANPAFTWAHGNGIPAPPPIFGAYQAADAKGL